MSPQNIDPEVAALGEHLHHLLTSGVKISSVRLVQAVCEHQRKLASVLRINGRLVVIYSGVVEQQNVRTTWTEGEYAQDTEVISLRRGDSSMIGVLDDAEAGAYIVAANRCCSKSISAEWLIEMASSHASRVVVGR